MATEPNSAWKFPPTLIDKHEEELAKRGIPKDFAIASGVRTAADNELRALNFQASLPISERRNGLQGICFPYVDLVSRLEVAWRLKPDTKFTVSDGKQAKYLSRIGDKVKAYFPHTTTADDLSNIKTNVIITEGEFKTLSIAHALSISDKSKRTVVIGLQGVNGGWHREKVTVPTADGGHERKSTGPPQLIEDLRNIEWNKRRVYICFDSDVGSLKQAQIFKQSKYAGAWGAEYILCELLRSRGAEVRIIEIPDDDSGEKVGADDYIAKYGPYAFHKLAWNSWTPRRDPEEVLHRPQPDKLVFVEAKELVNLKPPRPIFVIEKLLPEAGTMIIAAAPKVGKSGIALNAAHAVATGDDFLGMFPVRKGRCVYIQTEIPAWSMAERLKLMGELPDGMLIHTPGRMKLNLWEEDGYQKRRDTGNAGRIAALIEALKAQAASLVIFDPLRHFHSLSETNVDHISHLFEVFRAIGRAVPCGVMVVHHHRKIGRSQIEYEGAEDMSGHNALFGEADAVLSIYQKIRKSDDTRRYKLIFNLRHAETPLPMELFRMSGEDAMRWTAEPWEENQSDVDYTAEKIMREFEKNPLNGWKPAGFVDALKISKATAYRKLSGLVHAGRIEKKGNVYFIRQEAQNE